MLKRFLNRCIAWLWSGSPAALSVIIVFALLVTGGAVYGLVKRAQMPSDSASAGADRDSQRAPLIYRRIDGKVTVASNVNDFLVGVMIDNSTAARPQFGLGVSPVVYETLAEGGITRFLAIFAGESIEKIGPVRSARPYYLEWISEYDAGYAHAGGSPDALQAIAGLGIRDISGLTKGAKYFFRGNDKPAPHNLYTTSQLLGLAVRDFGWTEDTPTYQSWPFVGDATAGARPAAQEIDVRFSNSAAYDPHYVYDPTTNAYARWYGKAPHVDALTDEQISVKNVVVVFVPRETSGGDKGRILLDIQGKGTAVVFRNGEAVPGTWEKPSRVERTRFYDANGTEIPLVRGNTWIDVLPGARSLEYTTPEGSVEWVGGVRK